MRTFTLAILCATALLHAEDYTLGPDSQPQNGVPKGTVTKYKLGPGKFYPGTPHDYSIYTPARYDAAKPAPFMIFLDGSGSLGANVRVPVVFDNLIAKHDLPPLIGIFVDPGVLPAVSDQAQNRFERVFEYDSLSDRYSRFLLEELIPEVAKKYNLSSDPNDRALSGVSTGAVGAFMAAWNRPDQFHRVLSFIGTYVSMKGADSLPALIRKTEPKPIRIFLQDGKNDHVVPTEPYGTFYAGSWPINNQVMFEAFESAGYDAKLVIGDEGHNMKQGGAIMPDALRWLWRDYPAPIAAHEPVAMSQAGWDPRGKVYSTVSTDKPWEQVGETYGSVTSAAIGPESLRRLRTRRRRKNCGAQCGSYRYGNHGRGRHLPRRCDAQDRGVCRREGPRPRCL
jgi:gluconolactonase